jgi:hypothetical protein
MDLKDELEAHADQVSRNLDLQAITLSAVRLKACWSIEW